MSHSLTYQLGCVPVKRGLDGHQSDQPEEEKFILDQEEHQEEVVSSQDGNVVEPQLRGYDTGLNVQVDQQVGGLHLADMLVISFASASLSYCQELYRHPTWEPRPLFSEVFVFV